MRVKLSKKTKAIGVMAMSSLFSSHIYVNATQRAATVENMPTSIDEIEEQKSLNSREKLNSFLFIGTQDINSFKDTIIANNDKSYVYDINSINYTDSSETTLNIPSQKNVNDIVLVFDTDTVMNDEKVYTIIDTIKLIDVCYPQKNVYLSIVPDFKSDFINETYSEVTEKINSIIKKHSNYTNRYRFIGNVSEINDEYMKNNYDNYTTNELKQLFYDFMLNSIKDIELDSCQSL